ncbi:MAG: recombinase family protein [Acidobacteria bacterium]|nr:recombinase family protein [Acidobacteriota bacterium]MCA1620671.1 recombinase family protein [Acidobacteriota bacterium]
MSAPPRYAFYARTSSDTQKKDETIETQLKAARDWSERTGIPMREHYLDDGVSSKTPFVEREHGARLISDARAGRLTHVLAYSFRRLGRDQLDTLQTVKTLSDLGVSVQSICEPVPDGGEADVAVLMIGVLTSFGQYDWVQLRRLLSAGKEKWAGEGYWPGGPPPFGYSLAGERRRRLARNEEEIRALRRVGDLYLTGDYSQHRLADLLNADRTPTPKAMRDGSDGYRWTGSLLCALLSNPLYTGRVSWRGKVVAVEPELG